VHSDLAQLGHAFQGVFYEFARALAAVNYFDRREHLILTFDAHGPPATG